MVPPTCDICLQRVKVKAKAGPAFSPGMPRVHSDELETRDARTSTSCQQHKRCFFSQQLGFAGKLELWTIT